ncbi:MAG: hypothetical protein QNJ72_45455 [Pleurocapsa sp. MO_226.B13]|nr:hypothetical protein [Pleurocapsa sp. MO_226.B13]
MKQGKNKPTKFREDLNQSGDRQINCLSRWDLLYLLGWFVVGIILRFTNLADKSASSIEIATLGFSLGHGFSQIPLNQIIPASTLLSPLKLDTTVNSADVVTRLLNESTHPPLYFWLTHWWIELFFNHGELVSLAVGRSLSAIFGGLTIPAIFGLSWVAFRSRLSAHLTAILMAVSPYGIYLAQEARHYSLSVLLIIASSICLMLAIESVDRGIKLPWAIGIVWILINSLGIATHYFFGLALVIQALILVGIWFRESQHQNSPRLIYWWRIILVVLATVVAGLVWLPVANEISNNQLTDWIATSYSLDEIWQPILRILGWLITTIALLPIEDTPIAITVTSGLVVLLVLIWMIPALLRGWKLLNNSPKRLPLKVFSSYCLGAIILYLFIIYGYGKDLSLAARYHFVYFPAVIVLLGAILAQLWQYPLLKTAINNRRSWLYAGGKKVALIAIAMGLLGSLTVVNNLGFQKSRQSNHLAEHILANTTTSIPTLVATSYTTHSQLREAIALALSFQTIPSSSKAKTPQFLLLGQHQDYYFTFRDIVLAHPKPLDIWSVNLKINPDYLTYDLNCIGDLQSELSNSGYRNRLYHCR